MKPDQHTWTTTHIVHRELLRVVAVVNHVDDEIFDWAAYHGEHDTPDDIAKYGDKLYKAAAFALFPDLPQERWRS